jgi:hypothetical protein
VVMMANPKSEPDRCRIYRVHKAQKCIQLVALTPVLMGDWYCILDPVFQGGQCSVLKSVFLSTHSKNPSIFFNLESFLFSTSELARTVSMHTM